MKHLLRRREVPIALISGVAAAVAAGAFGLTAASASDPAPPIELDAGDIEPVTPVPIGDGGPVHDDPTVVTPAEPELTQPASPSAASVASPAPAPAPSPASVDSPPATTSSSVQASYDSPDSPPSAGSIDS